MLLSYFLCLYILSSCTLLYRISFFFFLMCRLPPGSTRPATLFPSTTLFRSDFGRKVGADRRLAVTAPDGLRLAPETRAWLDDLAFAPQDDALWVEAQIGRAHV